MRPFDVTLAAEPTSPRAARAQLTRWLESAHWPDDERDAIVYAASEAVSNSVEHAYPPGVPGEITLTAQLETPDAEPGTDSATRRIRVTVTDQGTWREPPASSEGRRRGLQVIEALMHSVTIHRPTRPVANNAAAAARNGRAGGHRTTVILLSTPVPR